MELDAEHDLVVITAAKGVDDRGWLMMALT
jgi:hypothetical protein